MNLSSVHNMCMGDADFPPDDETLNVYSQRVNEFSARYEALPFADVHASALDLLPDEPGFVLDVGAGSGRDAAWFAERGWDVCAVEPVAAMLAKAARLHPSPRIQWIQDRLPKLEKTLKLGTSFDVVWVSAVWMHLPPKDRARAFRKLSSLVKPGGILVITYRDGVFPDERAMHAVSAQEMEALAREHCLTVRRATANPDFRAREQVVWQTFVFQMPHDGTESLPLLRHIILNDRKSSTYKLALLRVLVKIAESARGVARQDDEGFVEIPLGLVALYWIRMYKPLLNAQIRQNTDPRGLGFVKSAFESLSVSNFELRIGAAFSGDSARNLHQALKDARDTIHKMPATYITYPNSTQKVFLTEPARITKAAGATLMVDAEYLWQFGIMRIPEQLWLALCRFGAWIEPSLVSEWLRLMQDYGKMDNRRLLLDDLAEALQWSDPIRETAMVRAIIASLTARGKPVYCVWSGKKLGDDAAYDVDHCFPFSAWACGDLWNLMPADRRLNQHAKREKLVSAELLANAEDRIQSWWHDAYVESQGWHAQFFLEAHAALPIASSEPIGNTADVFRALKLKRATLKRDLQIAEWDIKP